MNQRQLLVLAIIAFDIMIDDAITEDSKGEEFHPVATKVLKYLVDMLSIQPDLDHGHQQYLLNVAEIGAAIKRIFLATPIDEDALDAMLQLQAERLRWLGAATRCEESERTTSPMDKDHSHLH